MVCIGAGSIHTLATAKTGLTEIYSKPNRNSQLTKLQHVPCAQQPERKNCLPTCTTINAYIMSDMSCLQAGYTGLACPDASTTGV
jgi:hypothetical protein